ncbi:glycoside hydrolase family 3 N-terminal domain-containing protein [Leucobacter triazinivorans]|uniref:Glycoside hydrolase family 3 protein n=1 Tax=Leucobacter triazinivorans TaxID=1784719 RepID=A0A4P6KB27_9MICO|nr:glycoside hydrolase family 3 N-terminal domain-containing protein [Leucobacter triazinivorans]QBE47485.1 glycoside hydrolase family 3 protein [Leucobacter triazinivorans]
MRILRSLALLATGAAMLVAPVACAPAPVDRPGAGAADRSAGASRPGEHAAPRASSPVEARHQRAVELVASATTRENVASILMATAPGTDPDALGRFMAEHGLGGFILMGDNVPATPEGLAAVTAALSVDPEFPALIAIDEEGGAVTRLPWDDLPGADTLKHDDAAAAEQAFAGRAALLADAGANVNFGIVADITDDPGSFIFPRALGTAPADSAARVAAAVRGEQGRVFSTLKHFPGHGAAPGDSHAQIPRSAQTPMEWQAHTAPPFRAGIDAGAELLMFGHLEFPAIDAAPASLSAEWHRRAREELGFAGVAVTDDLGMLLASGVDAYRDPVRNAAAALAAGNDLIVLIAGADEATLAATIDGLTTEVEAGRIPRERLEEAAVRVAELRLEARARDDAHSGTAPSLGDGAADH